MGKMPQSVRDVEQRVGGSGRVEHPDDYVPSRSETSRALMASAAAMAGAGRQMKKRTMPDVIKFDSPGVTVSGVLVRMNVKRGDTKNYMEYILHNLEDGKVYRFNGSYEIDNQIFRTDLNKYIEVTYVGEDSKVIRNGNALKKFEVSVEEGGKGGSSLEITDEDIPF